VIASLPRSPLLDISMPRFELAQQRITVQDKQRLTVTLSSPRPAHPHEEVELSLRATRSDGTPAPGAAVTFIAVNKALLQLYGRTLPFSGAFHSRESAVVPSVESNLEHLVHPTAMSEAVRVWQRRSQLDPWVIPRLDSLRHPSGHACDYVPRADPCADLSDA